MISLLVRKLKIVMYCAAVFLLVLGAVVAFQIADRDDQVDTVNMAASTKVQNMSEASVNPALMPPAHDAQSKSIDESSAAQARVEDLKKKLRADHTDFGRMKRDLEDRLNKAPDGKITPEEVLAVIPPEHREEFKSIITSMYTEQNEPMTMKETRP